jgi:nucleoside-diphosphate-sugar epimerase
MIYGGPHNRNINLLRRMVRWLRVFPIVGEGSGLRQPVHASRVADACLAALDRERVNGVYTIAGGDVLSYREMVERVFQARGIKPRFVQIPQKPARLLVRLAGRLPGLDMLSVQMLERLNRDQAFSNEKAMQDFGYRPGPFKP